MQDIKITLITVCFNAGRTIGRCIRSVIEQDHDNLEYIIIDGGSTDQTLHIINSYKDHIAVIVSEPDGGIYDAINKGIALATGQVIGMLNADDRFADEHALTDIAQAFTSHNTGIIYGDLDYVNSNGVIIRKWRSGKYKEGIFNFGWMPPHPTFYCKKSLYLQYGCYSLDQGTAADYELMLRMMHKHQTDAVYIQKVLVKMEIGGVSNKSFKNRVRSMLFDLKAMRYNGIKIPVLTILLKPLRKIVQYI